MESDRSGNLCARMLLPFGEVTRAQIRWKEGKFTQVRCGDFSEDRLSDAYTVIPALLDLHTHGGGGVDVSEIVSEADDEATDFLGKLSGHAARCGASHIVPTLLSSSVRDTERFLRLIRDMSDHVEGALIAGAHLEGPFLSADKPGVHPVEHLRKPDVHEVRRWMRAGGEFLKIVSLAPELARADEVIKMLVKNDTIVSLGHTVADFSQMMRAFDLGAKHVTHLFNGMQPMHHRRPGASAAALLRPGVTCELIGDGVHVVPEMAELVKRVKDRDEICMITDSTALAAMDEGSHRLGDKRIWLEDEMVVDDEGKLAGSAATPAFIVRTAVKNFGWSLSDAVHAMSAVPADALRINSGRIAPGRRADFCVLDQNLRPVLTYVGGREVFSGYLGE